MSDKLEFGFGESGVPDVWRRETTFFMADGSSGVIVGPTRLTVDPFSKLKACEVCAAAGAQERWLHGVFMDLCRDCEEACR